MSIRELVVITPTGDERVTVKTHRDTSRTTRQSKEAWKKLAEEIYELRSKVYEENVSSVMQKFSENGELIQPLIERCPAFETILAHILLNTLGLRAQEIDFTSEMVDWEEESCRRVGHSFAFFLRKRKSGEVAAEALLPARGIVRGGDSI